MPTARKRKREEGDELATRSSKRGKVSPPDVDFFRYLQDPPQTPTRQAHGSKKHRDTPNFDEKREGSEEEKDDSELETPTKRPRRKERAESPAYSPSTSSDDEEVNISKRETENLLYILTREKALRLTEAFKVPDMFDMGGEEKNLYLSLALRGCKPVMAEHWQKDFTTLPKSLFAREENESLEGARSPLLKSLGRSDFSAIRAFKDLLNAGATVRDCQHLVTEPQMETRKAIDRYLRWAIADGGLHSSPETIPVHATQVQRPGQTALVCLTQLTSKLENIAKRFHEALTKSSDPWWPTLVGFALCGPVMTLVSLDTDVGSSAWSGEKKTPVKIIGNFDLAERDEDVWNALAIAIAIIHIRDTMARLASVNAGSHVPRFLGAAATLRFMMDATEDRDSKLQRASGDLVTEFSAKLPSLLWRSQNGASRGTPRKWAQVPKTEKLVSLLEPFQEWPQLLDPHLQTLLPPLVDAFLGYLVRHRGQYAAAATKSSQNVELYPLPRAICRLLYTFCKIRGAKVISRFLNNEPKYLESMLRAFIEWDITKNPNPTQDLTQDFSDVESQSLHWEERYVMLVWLSHLLLAPFDLSSLSSDDIPVPYDNLEQLSNLSCQTPMVARSLLSLALHYINAPGKEREAAAALLARLVLRGDMQALGLLTGLTKWAFDTIRPSCNSKIPSVYSCIGVLSFIARLGGSGQVEDFAPLLREVFEKTISVSQGQSEVTATIQSSALTRKIVVKIIRNITVMALSLSERDHSCLTDDQLSSILEDAIDYFLVALADKDTPVRFAASKALSVITLKLDPDMGAEVIEAVIGSLGENILFERDDGALMTPFEAKKAGIRALRRNLSAVDAQRWQGLILTLSHLLFRRVPPIHQLPDILQSLVSGLDFEQRSSTGSSVGTSVRDAACFGVWAMSRKYTTTELQALPLQKVHTSSEDNELEVLQKLAVELVCSACVDPSGNIRRGASAALQELIGRHPNTITEGIPLVQVVDYHAVARRSRAMVDVAKATASLDGMYWSPLLAALMNWRGSGSPDAESRRHAARSIGSLSTQKSFKTIGMVLQRLLLKLPRIPRSDVESRHGCLLSISATVDAYIQEWEQSPNTRDASEAQEVLSQVSGLWDIFESSSGPSDNDLTLQSSRPELTAEAFSCLAFSLCRSIISIRHAQPPQQSLARVLHILSLCVCRNDDVSIEASSRALSTLFPLLSSTKQEETLRSWFSHLQASSRMPSGRGQILALGAIFKQLEGRHDIQEEVITELLRYTGREELIEKRVAAVKCFATQVLPHTDVASNVTKIFEFLNDYTTDRRGDVGSLIRVEAIHAVKTYLMHSPTASRSPIGKDLLGCLFRLASEKLDRVRLQAWLCLQDCWELAQFEPLQRKFEHVSDVSSREYFTQLLTKWPEEWLRLPLLQGLATSAVAGAEGLVRSSRAAVIQFLNSHEQESRQGVLVTFLQVLSAALSDNLQDDRYAIPIIELMGFLIDNFAIASSDELDPIFRKTFVLVQKAHFRSSNIIRLEAAVKLYGALSSLEPLRNDVLKKLSGMLLHPFPRIRTCVAEYLFTMTDSDTIKYEDWSAQPKQLKEKVEILRADLVLAK